MKRSLTLFQRRWHSVGVMRGRTPAHFVLALLGAWGLAAPALPQDVTAPCSLCAPGPGGFARKTGRPGHARREVNLNFDRLVLDGSGDGSAELGPDGVSNISGSITAIGGPRDGRRGRDPR
jgi:hypothetical protein